MNLLSILPFLFILPLAANCQKKFAKEEIESLREFLVRTNLMKKPENGTAEKIVKIVVEKLAEHKKVFRNCSTFEKCTFWVKMEEKMQKWLNYLPKAANPAKYQNDSQSVYLCEIAVRPHLLPSNASEADNSPLGTVKIVELILAVKNKEKKEIVEDFEWPNAELIKWMEKETAICKGERGDERQSMRRFLHSIFTNEQEAITGKAPKFSEENLNERVRKMQ